MHDAVLDCTVHVYLVDASSDLSQDIGEKDSRSVSFLTLSIESVECQRLIVGASLFLLKSLLISGDLTRSSRAYYRL